MKFLSNGFSPPKAPTLTDSFRCLVTGAPKCSRPLDRVSRLWGALNRAPGLGCNLGKGQVHTGFRPTSVLLDCRNKVRITRSLRGERSYSQGTFLCIILIRRSANEARLKSTRPHGKERTRKREESRSVRAHSPTPQSFVHFLLSVCRRNRQRCPSVASEKNLTDSAAFRRGLRCDEIGRQQEERRARGARGAFTGMATPWSHKGSSVW